jgi:vancomycin resistance protein YoaR
MTTTTEAAPAAATADPSETMLKLRRLPRGRVLVVAFVLGIVAALGATAAALYAYDQVHVGRVFPGVHVGSVDLSNLDRDTAAARLRDAFGSVGQGQIALTGAGVRETVSYSKTGRGADIQTLLDQAFAIGRSGNMAERAIDQVRTASEGATIEPLVTLDGTAVAREVAALASRVGRDPVDATVVRTTTGSGYTTTPAVIGRVVDESATANAVVAALRDPKAPAELALPLAITEVAPNLGDSAAHTAAAEGTAMIKDVKIVEGKEHWTIKASTVRKWITFAWANGVYSPTVDTKQIRAVVKPLATKIDRSARDAEFLLNRRGSIVGVTASLNGRKLDVKAMTSAIQTVLVSRADGTAFGDDPLDAAITRIKPKLTTEVARKSAPLMRRISSWTTYYQSGPHNGFSANISIPAMAIDGTVVAPGQWFSFWKTVGEVSVARGYRLGGAIVDGRSVEGHTIGGGICSTSTTIFNAALRAGFQMGARKNHYYYISRYPKGLDATVYISDGGGVQDMTFRNDSAYPVLIKAYARPGIVRFTLYSVPTGRRTSFTAPTVRNYRPSTTVVQYTSSLRPGARSQIEYEAAGFDSWVTRTVRDRSGKIIHRDTYFSHYARVVGIILVGRR